MGAHKRASVGEAEGWGPCMAIPSSSAGNAKDNKDAGHAGLEPS